MGVAWLAWVPKTDPSSFFETLQSVIDQASRRKQELLAGSTFVNNKLWRKQAFQTLTELISCGPEMLTGLLRKNPRSLAAFLFSSFCHEYLQVNYTMQGDPGWIAP
jgi:hypothetical protein